MPRLTLSALKVHLAHCAAVPGIGRYFGLTFTPSGVPGIATIAPQITPPTAAESD